MAKAARSLAPVLAWICLVAIIVFVARRGDVRPGDAPYVAVVALYVGLIMLVLAVLWRHRGSRLLVGLLGLLALGLGVFGVFGGVIFFTFVWQPTSRGHLEVWNRTLTPIRTVGRELTIEVPACGHVSQNDFVLNRYFIRDDQGRFIAEHGGDDPISEMVTSTSAVGDLKPPAEPLPECEGVAKEQPGSESSFRP